MGYVHIFLKHKFHTKPHFLVVVLLHLLMDIETSNCGVVSEQFLDKDGMTILWRRFNRDDWAIDRYKKKWSEQLPENDKLTVNGTTYVHWYDCITDYIL